MPHFEQICRIDWIWAEGRQCVFLGGCRVYLLQ
jgi:hypothetical protein